MKIIIAIVGCLFASGLMAETAHFSTFGITIPDQWIQEMEPGPADNWGSTLRLTSPNGEGVLKVTTFEAPLVISQERLRNLTNVPQTVPLKWQNWGDLNGFQYDYSVRDNSFRQWWLTTEQTVVIFVYEYKKDAGGVDSTVLDKVVRSITAANIQ